MQRFLLGFSFSIALLVAGTASALVMTSGEIPVIDHERWNSQNFQNFGELVATDIDLVPLRPTISMFGRRDFDWHFETPFEWPRSERARARGGWMGKFPFFAHFPQHLFDDGHPHGPDHPHSSPAPEPTTALLFGGGLLGLGLLRRRQR